jgi:hypothetical protein
LKFYTVKNTSFKDSFLENGAKPQIFNIV